MGQPTPPHPFEYWTGGTSSRKAGCFLHLETDPRAHRVNVAIAASISIPSEGDAGARSERLALESLSCIEPTFPEARWAVGMILKKGEFRFGAFSLHAWSGSGIDGVGTICNIANSMGDTPWFCAGDFNNTPDVLLARLAKAWVDLGRGAWPRFEVYHPYTPTCGARCLDYVVCGGLWPGGLPRVACEAGSAPSDHLAVSCEITFGE